MKSKLFFIVLLIVVGVGVFGFSWGDKKDKAETEIGMPDDVVLPESSEDDGSGFMPEIKTMGAVEVEVTPITVTMGEDVVFEVAINTHSVELGYDYLQIVTLVDDQDNEYKPIKWTGKNGGHHLRGELVFPSFSQDTKSLTLIFDGVDNKREEFSWKL